MDLFEILSNSGVDGTNQKISNNRRSFLIGSASLIPLGLLMACNSNAPVSINNAPEFKLGSNNQPYNLSVKVNSPRNDRLEAGYLDQLFTGLEQSSATVVARREALMKSMRIVSSVNIRGYGNGVQLDESGIYITASHVIESIIGSSSKDAVIINPQTAEADVVTSAIIHPNKDLAILFAPNGRQRKQVDNLSVASKLPTHNERLHFAAFAARVNGRVDQVTTEIQEGQINDSARKEGQAYLAKHRISLDFYVLSGVKPFGGSSGGGYITSEGQLIGVESGTYPLNAGDFSEYTGATFAPIPDIHEMARITPMYR